MQMTALVLGATGGFGGAVANELIRRGWHVRAMHRRPEEMAAANPNSPIEWIGGDAMEPGDTARAVEGVRVIVHGLNIPNYRDWENTVVPMLDHSIAAARSSGARLIVPGSVYNYGPDAGDLLTESSPQSPVSRKGAIRVAMERSLEQAARQGVRSLIIRSADYFGPQSPSSWLTGGIVTPGKPIRSIRYPGPLDTGHSWAYLPDLAEAAAGLIEIEGELADHERFHFTGHFVTGREFATMISDLVGGAKIGRLPWWAVNLARPFSALMRELWEIRYLWSVPHRLDGSKLAALMGEEPRTPLRTALQETLAAQGCFDRAQPDCRFRKRDRQAV